MIFTEAAIPGVFLVEIEPASDDRGFFARLQCEGEFARAGIDFQSAQTSLSRNIAGGTLRGMHYQAAPMAETKLVRVVRGSAFDVVVDLRPDSPTFRRWAGYELSAANGRAVFIPEGIAHGFLTLEPDTDVLYQIAPAYTPGHDRGVRWDDPAFAIRWPARPAVISSRDASYEDFHSASAPASLGKPA
jgi:dTDP-4-dehydrorhamnose 3,5-epimerase